MAKKQHACQTCGETFPTITDHMVHVSTAHDLRRTGGTDRAKRFWTCRHCGAGWCRESAPECDRCGRTSERVA